MRKLMMFVLLVLSINKSYAADGTTIYWWWENHQALNNHRVLSPSLSIETQRQNTALLLGYIDGITDMTRGKVWCPTWQDRKWDIANSLPVVLKYMQDHSALISSKGGEIITNALSEKYPC